MPFKAKSYERCPYLLPPLPALEPVVLKRIKRRNVLRFLYIEGLLRSPVVWELYRNAVRRTRRKTSAPPIDCRELLEVFYGDNPLKGRGPADAAMRRLLWDSSLRDQFHVRPGWAVLRSWHHSYLKHEPIQFRIGEGIVDLAMAHRSGHCFRVEYLTEERPDRLYLMVDPLEVSSSDLTILKGIIGKRRIELAGSARLRLAPDIEDLHAWLSYLRCYDLRQQGATYGDVSRMVLGAPVGRTAAAVRKRKSLHRQVTRACQRVKDLIAWAEQGPWIFSRL